MKSVSEAGLETLFAEGDWSDTKSTPLHVCIEQLSNPHNNVHSDGESKVQLLEIDGHRKTASPSTAKLKILPVAKCIFRGWKSYSCCLRISGKKTTPPT